jgi:hypothetical protein
MKKRSLKIEYLTVEEPNHSICMDYWEITDSLHYHYKVRELSNKYKVYPNGISQIVQSNSVLIVHCGNCEKKVGEYKKRSDFELNVHQEANEILCEDCRLDYQKLKIAEINEAKWAAMDIAARTEKYKNLNQSELETLVEIVESKTKNETVKKVFKGADMNGEYGQIIWKRINLLEKMDLIWVEREFGGSKIKNYHVNGNLRRKLKDEYSYLFAPKKGKERYQFKKFQFTMIENFRKKEQHPDYSGFFTVKEEIVLETNKEYQYGGWKNDDGTIFIRIEPVGLISSERFNLDDLFNPFSEE